MAFDLKCNYGEFFSSLFSFLPLVGYGWKGFKNSGEKATTKNHKVNNKAAFSRASPATPGMIIT